MLPDALTGDRVHRLGPPAALVLTAIVAGLPLPALAAGGSTAGGTDAGPQAGSFPSQAALQLNPDRVRWRDMQLVASKLLLTATTRVRLELVPSSRVSGEIIAIEANDPATALSPGSEVATLDADTRFLGKESRLRLLMAPDTAQAFQYVRDAGGDRMKHRILRYAETGIFVRTHRPGDKSQRNIDWQAWTDVSTDWRPVDPVAHGAVIVEPLGILYAVGAADLAPGAPPLELLSISDRIVTRVTLRAYPAAPRMADYRLSDPAGTRRCRGSVPAIRLELDGEPVQPVDDGADFEFLGLREDIAIYVEPESRLVLEVTGKAPVVGALTIRLQQATLTVPANCPAT